MILHSVEINDDARGTYGTNSQIKFKTATKKVCSYSDVYILAKETISKSECKSKTRQWNR